MKLVVEPTAPPVIATLPQDRIPNVAGKRIGIIMSAAATPTPARSRLDTERREYGIVV